MITNDKNERRTIVLIDDNLAFHKLLPALLAKWGYQAHVVSAYTHEGATEAIARHSGAAIFIVDGSLNDFHIIDTQKHVAHIHKVAPEATIIVRSGNIDAGKIFEPLGAHYIMSKAIPHALPDLLTVLKTHLNATDVVHTQRPEVDGATITLARAAAEAGYKQLTTGVLPATSPEPLPAPELRH